ncbi:MAG: hypothetical protein ACRDZU_08890 [Acidimicrobiales bacterium]
MRRLVVLVLGVLVPVASALAACGGDGDSADGDPVRFCELLDRLTANDPFLAFGDTASADEIEVAFGALIDRADELVDVAPPAAHAAATDYADAAAALDALLADAAYVGADVDAAAYRHEQTAYVAAAQRLERYLEGEC